MENIIKNFEKVTNDPNHNFGFYTNEKLLEIYSIMEKMDLEHNLSSQSFIEKILFINEFVKENVSIRSKYFRAMELGVPFLESELQYRTAYIALKEKEAMCAGYTELIRLFLSFYSIESQTLLTKLPGRNKQLLHYVCAVNYFDEVIILDPEREFSCLKKGYDFYDYSNNMTFILPEMYFNDTKTLFNGLGPLATDYLGMSEVKSVQGVMAVKKLIRGSGV